MWKDKKVSLVFPTYNEKGSICSVIKDFQNSGYIDEIIVVNNNAALGTREEIEKTSARQVFEPKQGYGHAIRRGLDEVTGSLIILAEPDGTFIGRDIIKLLVFSEDYDAVWGSRTDVRLVGAGANMSLYMRWGNFIVAKILQLLFNTTRLSDVGCTLKLFKREVIEKIKSDFTIGGSHFGPELMTLTASYGFEVVEVPVVLEHRLHTLDDGGRVTLHLRRQLSLGPPVCNLSSDGIREHQVQKGLPV